MNFPNVLILCADEHARAFTGCYGHSVVQTPTLNRLSGLGTTYERAYTPSPICVPARASLATGLQVHETRCWSSAEPYFGQHETWMYRMRDRGYTVMSFGKLHFRSTRDDNGFTEEVLPMHVSNDGRGWPQSLLRDPLPSFDETRELAADIGQGESDYTEYDRRIASSVCQWLRRSEPSARKKPWVLFVSFASPHYPLTAPPNYYENYANCEEPGSSLIENRAYGIDHPVVKEIRRFFNYDDYFDDKLRLEAQRCYYGLVSFLDDNIKQVLQALENSGNMNETVILYTSDHGDMLGHLGLWAKSVMYEYSVGVPLIAVGPGFDRQRCKIPVSLTDIGATVDHAAGIESVQSASWQPQPLQTISHKCGTDRVVLSQYHDGGTPVSFYMIRQGDWKYVYYAGGYRPQLFNLSKDPKELKDLGESSSALNERERLHNELLQILDPEEVARQCAQDQAEKIESLGGRETILAMKGFNHTPVQ